MTASREHVDAVVRVLVAHDPSLVGACNDHDYLCCPSGCAHNFRDWHTHPTEALLESTDPAVLAAFEDALVRAGMLREREAGESR